MTIYTNNTNTIDNFNFLAASPCINPILTAVYNISLTSILNSKVLYITGSKNKVADALSWFDIVQVVVTIPDLRVSTFEPPCITLGPMA